MFLWTAAVGKEESDALPNDVKNEHTLLHFVIEACSAMKTEPIPEPWSVRLRELILRRKEREKVIEWADFLCMISPYSWMKGAEWLHERGDIIIFPSVVVPNVVFLDPEWFCQHTVEEMKAHTIISRTRTTFGDGRVRVDEIWRRFHPYHQELLQFWLSTNVAFLLNDKYVWMPLLLDDCPSLWKGWGRYKGSVGPVFGRAFAMTCIPVGVVGKLLCRLYKLLGKELCFESVWREGFVGASVSGDTKFEAHLDYERRQLVLACVGEEKWMIQMAELVYLHLDEKQSLAEEQVFCCQCLREAGVASALKESRVRYFVQGTKKLRCEICFGRHRRDGQFFIPAELFGKDIFPAVWRISLSSFTEVRKVGSGGSGDVDVVLWKGERGGSEGAQGHRRIRAAKKCEGRF